MKQRLLVWLYKLFSSTLMLAIAIENAVNKQLLDEVNYDIMNYQNRGLCYLPQPSALADNTGTRF